MTTTYNEQDLTEALAMEAADVMDVDQLRARVGQRAMAPAGATPIRALARRRVFVPIAVAATVVALATPAAVRAIRDDRPNASGAVAALPPLTGPAFTLTTSVRPPKGMSVVNETVEPGQQRIVVDRETGYDYGGTTVSTYDGAAFKEKTFLATATRTIAAGHAAYFGKYPVLSGATVYLLAWKTSANQWISIENPPVDVQAPAGTPAPTLAAARAFAAYVTTQTSIGVTTPLRVRHVPAGLQRSEIDAAYPTRNQSWYSAITLTDPATPTRPLIISAEPARTGPDSVTVTANTTVAGHPAQYVARSTRTRLPELRVQIGSSVVLVDGSYTRAELGAIAAGITLVGHPADPKSWHNSMK